MLADSHVRTAHSSPRLHATDAKLAPSRLLVSAHALQVDTIGALLARPEALDARQRALREALARYDTSWRTELAARARALEVGGEHESS